MRNPVIKGRVRAILKNTLHLRETGQIRLLKYEQAALAELRRCEVILGRVRRKSDVA